MKHIISLIVCIVFAALGILVSKFFFIGVAAVLFISYVLLPIISYVILPIRDYSRRLQNDIEKREIRDEIRSMRND